MLISKTDIVNRPLSQNVSEPEINPFIEEAERIDLAPLLGELLYEAIKVNDQSKYDDLLNGGSYTYNSNNYTQPGLKRVLEEYTWARWVLNGSVKNTGFGLVEKNSQDSSQVEWNRKKGIAQSVKESAFDYWASVKRFLDRNYSDYPLWKDSCNNQKRRFKATKVV